MFDIVTPRYNHNQAYDYFQSCLHSSIDYLAEFYQLHDISKPKDSSWEMCAAHYLASKSAESDKHEDAVKYLRYINEIKNKSEITVTPLTSKDELFSKSMIIKIINDDRELGFGYCDDDCLVASESEKIFNAINVIKEFSPEAYSELDKYIKSIYLTKETLDGSRFMRSGTNFYMWGMMFVYINGEHTVPYYIDIIAHECGHTALNIINSFDEIVLNNPNDTFDAPLRDDKRPMIGIFHAFFVLSRICYVLKSISESGCVEFADECRDRFEMNFKKLDSTHKIVRDNAAFTPEGQRIYDGICELWSLS
ncbi:aKG-HExxH-type peptide beta-hydroxylase [Escherichia coli]